MKRSDRRLVIRPRLPISVIDKAECQAQVVGVSLADYLGDVVASQLPEAMAEMTRETLARGAAEAEELATWKRIS